MGSTTLAQRIFLPKLGRAKTISIGALILVFTVLGLALLKFIDNNFIFLAIALLLRLAQGGATAIVVTAGLALLSFHFPTSLEWFHNFYSNSINLGMALGPFIGSFLFRHYGYVGPFLVTSLLSIPPVFIKCISPVEEASYNL